MLQQLFQLILSRNNTYATTSNINIGQGFAGDVTKDGGSTLYLSIGYAKIHTLSHFPNSNETISTASANLFAPIVDTNSVDWCEVGVGTITGAALNTAAQLSSGLGAGLALAPWRLALRSPVPSVQLLIVCFLAILVRPAVVLAVPLVVLKVFSVCRRTNS